MNTSEYSETLRESGISNNLKNSNDAKEGGVQVELWKRQLCLGDSNEGYGPRYVYKPQVIFFFLNFNKPPPPCTLQLISLQSYMITQCG